MFLKQFCLNFSINIIQQMASKAENIKIVIIMQERNLADSNRSYFKYFVTLLFYQLFLKIKDWHFW